MVRDALAFACGGCVAYGSYFGCDGAAFGVAVLGCVAPDLCRKGSKNRTRAGGDTFRFNVGQFAFKGVLILLFLP